MAQSGELLNLIQLLTANIFSMSNHLSDAVMQHVLGMPQMAPPHDLSFPDILDTTIDALKKYPPAMLVQFQHEMGHSPVDSYGNITGLLTFAAYSANYRFSWLLEDVISGLNDGRPMRAIAAARGILELAVTTRRLAFDLESRLVVMGAAYQAMMDIMEEDNFTPESLQEHEHKYQIELWEAINVLSVHASATRVNWSVMKSHDAKDFNDDLEKVEDDIKQRNVLTLLGKYSVDKAIVKQLQLYYALQCDYTHPNRGAHQLVTDWSNLNDNMISYNFSVNPKPDFGWTHSVRAIFTPLSMVMPKLVGDIEIFISLEQGFMQQFMSLVAHESENKPVDQ